MEKRTKARPTRSKKLVYSQRKAAINTALASVNYPTPPKFFLVRWLTFPYNKLELYRLLLLWCLGILYPAYWAGQELVQGNWGWFLWDFGCAAWVGFSALGIFMLIIERKIYFWLEW